MDKSECVDCARQWARKAVVDELCALCGLLGQLHPVEIAPDDWFLEALDEAGIEYDQAAMIAGYTSWVTQGDVEWKEHMVEYYDEVLRADKQRLPDADEKEEMLLQFNRRWVREYTLVGWEGALSTAAKALADYMLLQDGREPCDWARVSADGGAALEYGPYGRAGYALPLDDVDICVVVDGTRDPYAVHVSTRDMDEAPWAADPWRLYLSVAAAPRIALRPRSRSRFTMVTD